MDITRIKSVIESLLLVSELPVKPGTLAGILDTSAEVVTEALTSLELDYRKRQCGIDIVDVGGGYQFRTVEENGEWVRRQLADKPFRFSRAALETLAIIAYRQPVTRAEIEYLRGVDAGGVLRTLLDKQLIRILGKKDVPGKPLIYGTSKQFLRLFGLANLDSLPSLKEIADIERELSVAEAALMDDGDKAQTVKDA